MNPTPSDINPIRDTLIIVNGSILDSDAKYICHQCNCVTTNSKGLAESIFNKWPWANTYINRSNPSIVGTIDIMKNPDNNQYVVNMYAQYYPGSIISYR